MTAAKLSKLGLFTAIALAAAIATIFVIGKNKNWFKKEIVLSGDFKNISGLAIGAKAQLSGIIIGEVTDMYLTTDTTVKVEISVDAKYKKHIKKDAALSVGSDGLIGDKVINIIPGTPGAQPVNDKDVLKTYTAIEMDVVMNKLQTVVYNAADITGDLSSIVSTIKEGKGPVGRLLMDSTMGNDLGQTFKNLNKGSKNLNQDLEAAKHNILLRGYFKKKNKQ